MSTTSAATLGTLMECCPELVSEYILPLLHPVDVARLAVAGIPSVRATYVAQHASKFAPTVREVKAIEYKLLRAGTDCLSYERWFNCRHDYSRYHWHIRIRAPNGSVRKTGDKVCITWYYPGTEHPCGDVMESYGVCPRTSEATTVYRREYLTTTPQDDRYAIKSFKKYGVRYGVTEMWRYIAPMLSLAHLLHVEQIFEKINEYSVSDAVLRILGRHWRRN